jgi:hypothetical protein
VFIAIALGLAVWSIIAWAKAGRRSYAFVSLLLDSVSLLIFTITLVWVMVIGGFDVHPSNSSVWLSISGLFSAVLGLALGLNGINRKEPAGKSAALIGICLSLLWLPTFLA